MYEAETIKRASQGDDAAWMAVMQSHQQAVFRLAYLLLRDADEAEDVAQETFIRAFRALHRFDHERPFRPWLLQITANLSRNRQRSMRRYLAMLGRLGRSQPEPVAFNGERSGPQWEADQLWRAISRLRMVDREILYLRYFLDLTESEVASMLHVAPGTVKSRLSRATSHLRTLVDREFPSLREERQA